MYRTWHFDDQKICKDFMLKIRGCRQFPEILNQGYRESESYRWSQSFRKSVQLSQIEYESFTDSQGVLQIDLESFTDKFRQFHRQSQRVLQIESEFSDSWESFTDRFQEFYRQSEFYRYVESESFTDISPRVLQIRVREFYQQTWVYNLTDPGSRIQMQVLSQRHFC